MPDPYKTPTPGLLATRRYNRWYVLHEASGNVIATSNAGRFTRMKDAKAAAGRLGDVGLDWTSPTPFDDAKGTGRDVARIREAIYDALTGTTAEERRQAAKREQERKDHERRGGYRRDHAEKTASELGHDLWWRRYGARSWKATCGRCGRGLRLPWSSMKREYERAYGDVLQERCGE